ncbi:hypothetical protein F7725_014091 [Dissostichus mawsoni]|uniref:Uncharacterized protein n=1 Tax=Dissostichus mawsoni TaxID=36200 RepID=A0A7J5YW41_DISMA|nr:hypothetical protein F7725_014091 [Dissostichus mawsoni]
MSENLSDLCGSPPMEKVKVWSQSEGHEGFNPNLLSLSHSLAHMGRAAAVSIDLLLPGWLAGGR